MDSIRKLILGLVLGCMMGMAPATAKAGPCQDAYMQAQTDVLLAMRRALGDDLAVYRSWNAELIARFRMASAATSGTEEELRAAVLSHGLGVDSFRTVCPAGTSVSAVGYTCVDSAGAPVEPTRVTRGVLRSVGGALSFVVTTRFDVTLPGFRGYPVQVTRGFVTTTYDDATGAVTEGNNYGVTSATRFNGQYYNEFLDSLLPPSCR